MMKYLGQSDVRTCREETSDESELLCPNVSPFIENSPQRSRDLFGVAIKMVNV